MKEFRVPRIETGFGICDDNQFHGDIEHFYFVDLNEQVIEHYSVSFGSHYDTPEELRDNSSPTDVYALTGKPDAESIEEVKIEEVTA